MSYESKGQEVGKIQIYLPDIDIPREIWERLEKPIARFANVTRATVSAGGWLTVMTNLAKFKSEDDLATVLEELENRVKRACQAKIKVHA